MLDILKRFSYYKNPISKQLFVSLIIQGIYTVVTPLSMIILARFLGPEEFGDFAFSISFVIILSIFSNLGLPVVVTRFGAMYYIKEQWEFLKGLITFSNKRVAIFSIAIILICWLLIYFDIIELTSKTHVLFALPIVLFFALSNIRTAILTAVEKVNLAQLPEMIIRPSLFLLLILLLYYFNVLNSLTAVIFYSIVNLVIFIVGVYFVKKHTKNKTNNTLVKFESKLWINSSVPLFLLGSIQVFGAQADVFLLGLLADSDEAGIFKSMYQISLLVIFSLSAINAIASPHIVRCYEGGNIKKLKQMLIVFCFVNFIFAAIIASPFLFFGEFFIELLYGKAYIVGFTCLQILIIGRLFNSIFGISNQFLKMMGKEKQATIGILAGAIVGILLNIVLIPEYGIIGAAISSATGLVTWNICLFIITVKNIWK